MSDLSVWIARCRFQDNISQMSQEYVAHVAVWTNGAEGFRARLLEHLAGTSLRLMGIEDCLESHAYVAFNDPEGIGSQLARETGPDQPIVFSDFRPNGVVTHPDSLKAALLALDPETAPVCAVLDGAQFDDLPGALLDGDFLARSLYLDRGDNNPEQIITAPHLVLLDERREKAEGRSFAETVEALFALIDGRAAAVFWQHPGGADALFAHLRRLNRIMVPKSAEQLEADSDAALAHARAHGHDPIPPDTHERVTFRHADANAMAQVFGAATAAERARLFGEAQALYFAPDPDWADGRDWVHAARGEDWPAPRPGPLRLGADTWARMGQIRHQHRQRKIMAYLRKTAPVRTAGLSEAQLGQVTARHIAEAEALGVSSEAGIGRWSYLQLITGGEMGKQRDVVDFLTGRNPGHDPRATPDQRVRILMQMAAAQAEKVAL